jgi:Ca2+-transporting ATPase
MCLYALVATILVTELGLFQRIFDTVSLSVNQWILCLVVGSVIAWVMEVEKFVRRRRAAPPDETEPAPAAPATASATASA